MHYNAAGQVIQRDKPSGVGAYYKYDNMGHLTEEVRYPSGDRIRYAHDVAGGTVRVEKSGVPTERWYFDAAGRVTRYRSVQPGGVSAGLPTGVNSPGFAGASGPSYDLYYEYDEAGNRTQMAFLGGGVTYFTYYQYDERNLLSALTDPLGQTVYYERDELGREIAKRLPNGVTTYHNYDLAGQVESILHVGPAGVLQSLYYTYDTDGQRTKIEREDRTRVYFGYDAAHRLTGEDWLDPSDTHIYGFAYEYDAADNRLRKTFNGEVTYYDYNNLNQLTTERVLGGEATYYTWTADGAMATKQEAAGWTYYTWDVDESLKQIEAPNVTLENKYNSRMQRVWRREDGNGESLVYDAQKLVAEAATGGLERYYLSEGGSVYSPLVSQLGSQHWFQFDALGTTLGLTDGAGNLTDTFQNEAFGTSLGRTGETGTPHTFGGGFGYYCENSADAVQIGELHYTPATGGCMTVSLSDSPSELSGVSAETAALMGAGIPGPPAKSHDACRGLSDAQLYICELCMTIWDTMMAKGVKSAFCGWTNLIPCEAARKPVREWCEKRVDARASKECRAYGQFDAELVEKGYKARCGHLRGSGDTDAQEDCCDRFVDDLKSTIKQNKREKTRTACKRWLQRPKDL